MTNKASDQVPSDQDERSQKYQVEDPILPEPVIRRGVNESQWRTLCNSLFPGSDPRSVLMVIDYCKARNLDPMKKPCHIVQMEVKDSRTNQYIWRDVVLPGIYEYRTTAQRTGECLGHSEPQYGPVTDFNGVQAPEWASMIVYRWNQQAQLKTEYPVRVYFAEVVARKRDGTPNARWVRAPIQMLTKCLEAAGLREAFPEEIGGEPTAEEMEGQRAITIMPTQPAVIDVLKKLPDSLSEQVEVHLELLGLSTAARVVKINEYLGGGVVPDEGAAALIQWCQHELGRRRLALAGASTVNHDKPKAQREKKMKASGPTEHVSQPETLSEKPSGRSDREGPATDEDSQFFF